MQRATGLTAALFIAACYCTRLAAESAAIEWIDEREAAFKKADSTGRPLFIFFAEMNKGARLIEMSVFDDDAVKAALKDFICVRIDPFQHEDLAKKFNLQVAFAVGAMAGDGEVLGCAEGEFRGNDVLRVAGDALKKFGPIPKAADAARAASYAARAERALAAKEYAKAAKEAQRAVETRVRSSCVRRAKEILDEVEKAAGAALAEARKAEGASGAKARAAFEKIKSDFSGTKAASEAAARLDSLVEKGEIDLRAIENAANSAYRKALQLERLGRYAEAIAGYKQVLVMPTTEYTGMARAAIERLESDPAVAKAIRNAEEEKEAQALLRRAEMWRANSEFAKAADVYRQVTAEYPETTAAAEAWEGLRTIGPR
jgi:hypothetical protein